jgi:hypothetical protein
MESDKQLAPWSWALLEKLTVIQILWKFLIFHGNSTSNAELTGLSHWSRSWARWIQYTSSHNLSSRSIYILSPYLRLGLPRCLFPSSFPINVLYAFLTSHESYKPHLSDLSWFYYHSNIWVHIMKFSIIIFSSPLLWNSYILGPKILLPAILQTPLNPTRDINFCTYPKLIKLNSFVAIF